MWLNNAKQLNNKVVNWPQEGAVKSPVGRVLQLSRSDWENSQEEKLQGFMLGITDENHEILRSNPWLSATTPFSSKISEIASHISGHIIKKSKTEGEGGLEEGRPASAREGEKVQNWHHCKHFCATVIHLV